METCGGRVAVRARACVHAYTIKIEAGNVRFPEFEALPGSPSTIYGMNKAGYVLHQIWDSSVSLRLSLNDKTSAGCRQEAAEAP